MAHAVPGALRSDGKTLFLVYTYVWQEDVAKISKVPGAPRNVNPGLGNNMVIKRNHLLYAFQ